MKNNIPRVGPQISRVRTGKSYPGQEEAGIRCWVSGGWAINLFLGKQTRAHKDADVSILRRDQLKAARVLNKWEILHTQRNNYLVETVASLDIDDVISAGEAYHILDILRI